jgi:predicted AlkP superfamily phosphohydrolase/phosphomutase
MPRANRVLFLALDAGDRDLIARWTDEGLLPTFRELRETAASARTQNPFGLYVGAIWPSFWTGLSPAAHGRYCFSQLRTGTYDHFHVTPEVTNGAPFWDAFAAAGRRVAILDVPKTRLSPGLNGVQIVDWGTHDPELGFQTEPRALASEIARRIGLHPVGQCDAYLQGGAGSRESLRRALLDGIERKRRLAEWLLETERWDLFLAVFAESHCAGHQLWALHDPSHRAHDPELAAALGDPLRDVYVALDAALGELLARAGEDTAVFVLASHGMGPHYDGSYLLDEILRRLHAPPPAPAAGRAAARGAEGAWKLLPAAARARLKPLRDRVKELFGSAVTRPDLAARPCFATPNNDVYGGIRVNLAGREPEGKVRAGAEYEAFCAELTSDLLAFVNRDTGRPIVRRVVKTADVYSGERVRDLPDLLVEWERSDPIERIASPKTGPIDGRFPGIRTGDHKAEGMLFARGPGLAAGPIGRDVSITEIAPTIAAWLGVPLPDVPDRPVAELSP